MQGSKESLEPSPRETEPKVEVEVIEQNEQLESHVEEKHEIREPLVPKTVETEIQEEQHVEGLKSVHHEDTQDEVGGEIETSNGHTANVVEIVSDQTQKPSVRLRNYLLAVKAQQQANEVESKKDKHTEETPKPQNGLPGKPNDWGQHEYVTANQQQPQKPRGRKKKDATEVTEVKENTTAKEPRRKRNATKEKVVPAKEKEQVKEKKMQRALAAINKTSSKGKGKGGKQEYEALEVEEDIKLDKGAAFDAYAAASAAVDVKALEDTEEASKGKANKQHRKTEEPSIESTSHSKKLRVEATGASTSNKRKGNDVESKSKQNKRLKGLSGKG